MNAKKLLEFLFESSSLREDLLVEIKLILNNLLNNIDLSDELCARVDDKTFQFIKSWINEQ